MAKKLKEYYDAEYLNFLSKKIEDECLEFDKYKFLDITMVKIDDLEFSDRQTLVAKALKDSIDLDYTSTLDIFYKILGPELSGNSGAFTEGWWLGPIGKYVEIYGGDYFDETTRFSKELTKRFTGEYCMRPVILNFPSESFALLKEWSTDTNERVRRLSSECVRIRLPWAKRMDIALEHFDDYLEILENLRDDPDKYIQKSVANNLNDLYKEDLNKFNFIINKWQNDNLSKEAQWVVKHGSRTAEKDKNK